MRILYIAGHDWTIHPNHRAHHFVSFLERHYSHVDVIGLERFYDGPWPAGPWTRLRRGLRNSLTKGAEVTEREAGVEVVVRKLPGSLNPVAQDVWAYLQLGPLAGQRYDVCIFGNPNNVLLPLLLKMRGLVGTLIYDDWDYYAGFSDESWLWKLLMKWRAQLCVSKADIVISVGSLLAELRQAQGAAQTAVIPNGVDYRLFTRAHQKPPHPPTLVYIGKLADEYGIDVSLRGFAQVCQQIPDARYLIIGYNEGDYADYLRGIVQNLGLENRVDFVGAKRYEELPDLLAESDIGVALFRPNDLMKYAFPLKVVEYMAAGLPVIGTRIGETEKLIVEAQSGQAVAYSADAFASAAIDLLTDSRALAEHSARAREYGKQYDWDVQFAKFSGVIDAETALETPASGGAPSVVQPGR
jgi:glycosyltransferase involved in cell wall biosynthesis